MESQEQFNLSKLDLKTEKHFENIALVCDRAIEDIGLFDRLELFMDLDLASDKLGLDLEKLLISSRLNFRHDISGVVCNIDRQAKSFSPLWTPRHTI